MLALAGYPLGLDFLFLDRSADTPAGRFAPVLTGEFDRSGAARASWPSAASRQLRLGERLGRGAARRRARAARASPRRCGRWLRPGSAEPRSAPSSGWRSPPRASRRWTRRAALRARRRNASACPACSRRAAWATTARASACCAARRISTRAWERARQRAAAVRGVRAVRVRGVDHRCARARGGRSRIYPLNRNYHADGILRLTLAPWHAPRAGACRRPRALRRVLEAFHYVGVLTHRVLRAPRAADRQ